MILQNFAAIAVIIIMISSLGIILSRNWREGVIALAIQYIGVFWLVSLSWPLGLAAVKLVVGWMSGAVLGASQITSYTEVQETSSLSNRLFRLVASVIIWLLVFSLSVPLGTWLPILLPVRQGALMLIGMGLLQLGMTTQSFRVILGLLTTLSGFELLYAPLETSVLVAGLLVVINLGIALVGSYMVIAPTEGEEGE
jgi:hypothetical protein